LSTTFKFIEYNLEHPFKSKNEQIDD